MFARQATVLVFGLGDPHLDARGVAMGVVGLGVECLDLDIRLAFFDVAGRAGLDGLSGLDHARFVDGLVVLDDAETLGKLVILDVLHVDAQLAAFLQLGDWCD